MFRDLGMWSTRGPRTVAGGAAGHWAGQSGGGGVASQVVPFLVKSE